MKQPEPEDRDEKGRALERLLDEIGAGAFEEIDELDPADLALLIEREGSLEDAERLFDQLKGPTE